MSKYDDISWHYDGNFPAELTEKNASTHIGMFLGWAIKRNLEGTFLKEMANDGLIKLRAGEITGGEFVYLYCDGKLTSEDLNDDANKFAQEYYENDEYISDYAETLGYNVPTLYHIQDNLKNALLIENILDKRFKEYRKK
ncbi:hypothetical protein PN36_34480 [Candidatus Thiomargarita nelsonii]|uniref:DUF7832 domain-containing protein n=1 Tax=Candidatus Thiomargarita nelsonii TaxID=1003181 RepID=A0A0A6P1L8_9GAMM|nr:hypothetical protein PN36_34480 [Candidatus Thiomargarita nelsonii]